MQKTVQETRHLQEDILRRSVTSHIRQLVGFTAQSDYMSIFRDGEFFLCGLYCFLWVSNCWDRM